MTTKDYLTGSLILRLNALRQPLIMRGMMVWLDIFWSDTSCCDVQYTTGCWFIDGREVTSSDVDNLVTRMEGMEEHK